MSREIKFRAWDKKRKRYAKVIQTTNQGWKGYRDKTYITDGIMRFSKWVLSRFIIEQYIGLRDTNGKEIYEGDIVEVFSTDEHEMDFEGVCRVYFDDYWLSYQMYKIKSPYTKITFEPEMYDNIEIIGNIHENPELLGDTNVTKIGGEE